MIKSSRLPAESLLSLSGWIKVGRSEGPKAEKMESWMCVCVCESDKRISRIIKLTLRGRAGQECEQEMGESERTTTAFSLCKLTQTVRLSTSKGDYVTFLFSSWILLTKEEETYTMAGLKLFRISLSALFTVFLQDCLVSSYFHKAMLEESKTQWDVIWFKKVIRYVEFRSPLY